MSSSLRLRALAKSLLRVPLGTIEVLSSPPSQSTNAERWRDPHALHEDWDERTGLIARLIPEGADVIEFGAGRLALRSFLPAGCRYRPSDIVDRGENTLVCDLNRELPSMAKVYSHAVFSGVLEYIVDLPRLTQWLALSVNTVVASYSTIDRLSDPVTRARNGWLNHHTRTEVEKAFTSVGFEKHNSIEWREQTIFVFEISTHARDLRNVRKF